MAMGSLGFTLADRLGAKSIPCTVPGCSRTWIQMAGNGAKLGGRGAGNDADPTSRMCDPCREKFRTTADVQRRCARPGCAETWTWTAAEQMTAFASKQPPPDRLCDEDTRKMAALTNKEIPCSVEGCKRMSVFTRLAQLLAGAPEVEVTPPPTMCGPCGNVYEKIKDRPVTCGIQGCKNKWTWTRDEQIRDYAAGLPNEAPRRLCESCKGVFGAIADREVRCRTSGCKNTWHWPREAQLNAAVAGKPVPKAPHRMCQRCIEIYAATKDVERPCRRPGCKRTWTDKRGAQLARAVRGKTGDPYPRYCTECEKEVGELEDREIPCRTEHCPGTWTWTAAQQLAAGVRPVSKAEATAQATNGKVEAGAASSGAVVTPELEGQGPEAEEHLLATAEGAHEHANGAGEVDHADGEAAAAAAEDESGPTEAGSDVAVSGEAESESVVAQPGVRPAPGVANGAPGSGKKRRRRRRREVRPPERRCDDCVAFLKDRKTREIACGGCGTVIHWPPESQLQTHLGNWAEPTLCGACKRDLTEAARAAERDALRHHPAGQAAEHSETAASSGASGADPGAVASADQSGQNGQNGETTGEAAPAGSSELAAPDRSDVSDVSPHQAN
jgi:hypothetical protein